MNQQHGVGQPHGSPIWRIEEAQKQASMKTPAFHEWPKKAQGYHPAFFRLGDGFLIRFDGIADFVVSHNAHHVTTRPVPGVAHELIEDAYRNLVLPLALSQQQRLVFHASAIEIDQSAIVFVANSGFGKSTLAASFAANGFRFLADDCVWIDKKATGFFAMPGDPSLRIWPDSFEYLNVAASDLLASKTSIGKWRLCSSQSEAPGELHCDVPRPIKHIYFLENSAGGEIHINPVSQQKAVIGLLSHRFLLDVANKEVLADNIRKITALTSATTFFQLSIPGNFDLLPDIRSRIVMHTRDIALS